MSLSAQPATLLPSPSSLCSEVDIQALSKQLLQHDNVDQEHTPTIQDNHVQRDLSESTTIVTCTLNDEECSSTDNDDDDDDDDDDNDDSQRYVKNDGTLRLIDDVAYDKDNRDYDSADEESDDEEESDVSDGSDVEEADNEREADLQAERRASELDEDEAEWRQIRRTRYVKRKHASLIDNGVELDSDEELFEDRHYKKLCRNVDSEAFFD